jgi:hypothetical protein
MSTRQTLRNRQRTNRRSLFNVRKGGTIKEQTGVTHPNEHKLYVWSQTFSEAVTEEDPQKLREKVSAAEAAIFHRLQDLAQSDGAEAEIIALRKASDILLSLKTDVLKFPDWRQP